MQSILLTPLTPLLVLFTIVPLYLAACIKFSAMVLRRRLVSWKQSFVFAVIITAMSLIVSVASTILVIPLPLVLSLVLSIIIQLILGGWFFSKRSSYADGKQLGWRGAIELTAVAWVFGTAISTGGFLIISKLIQSRSRL